MKWFALLTSVTFAGLLPVTFAHAQLADGYPNRQIRIVMPFSAGGFADTVGRILSAKLSPLLGQSIVIDNKPGAGSTIGTDFVAKSAPDGYTLLMISTGHTVAPAIYKNLPFDPIKSFEPISELAEAPYVLVANAALPVKSVQDLVTYTKARPNTVNYASAGNGTLQALCAAMFANMTQSPIVHIPYRGSTQSTADLMSGAVQMSFVGTPWALQHADRLRSLAVTSGKRSPQMPDVPTLDEAGVSGYNATSWAALLAPAGTPKAIVAKLNGAIAKAFADPDAVKQLADAGMDVATGTPEALASLMSSDIEKWGKVARDTGMKMD